MHPWKIGRRTFLRGAGAAVALPMLDIMAAPAFGSESGIAQAGEAIKQGGAPKRLLCVFQPNGVYPKAWDVDKIGSDYQFSPILKPLEHLRNEILLISNLDNSPRGNHVAMTSAFLTGMGVKGGKCAISLDQMVAQKIGGQTLLPSLQLGTEPPRQGDAGGLPISFANTVSWSSDTTRLSPEINPRTAFDRLFRKQSGPEAEQAQRERLSVLDLVMDDAKRLRKKASTADRYKLDEYMQSVRSVETRIEKSLTPPDPDWTPSSSPQLTAPAEGIPKRRDEHLRLMIDLMVMAMWTDTTRVGTLMTAHGFSRQNFSFLDGITSDHHGMSHHKEQEKAVHEYTTVSTWYIEQFAYMLDKMKSVQEGERTLLDNSIVLYGCGMKDGNGHVRDNLPIILAGNGQGTISTGRHLQTSKGTPLANLHLSLLERFGIEANDFNGVSSGRISELTI